MITMIIIKIIITIAIITITKCMIILKMIINE